MDTLDESGPQAEARRSRAWFDLTQRYARQLHELDRAQYLIAKKREFENQKNLQSQIAGSIPTDTGQNDQ